METPADVADWMLDQLNESEPLYQRQVAKDLQEFYSDVFTHYNARGRLAINRDVLSAFDKLTKDSVVWVKRRGYWRWREDGDDPDTRIAR